MDRQPARPRASLAVAVAAFAVAFLVAGCIPGGSKTFGLVLAGEEPGIAQLPVRVTDESGHLRDAGQEVGFLGGAKPDADTWNPPGRPDKVLVTWTGGGCDESAELTLRARGNGFSATVTTKVSAGACDAIGIGRSVMLTFDRPVPGASVTIEPTR